MSDNGNHMPPPGWYPDPSRPDQLRWWDGMQWTDQQVPLPAPPPTGASPDALTKPRNRFMRELVGSKEVRSQAKTERLQARAESTALLRQKIADSRGGRTVASHQGHPPSLAQMLSELTPEPLRNPLDEQVEVVGETFHIAGIKKVFRGRGIPIPTKGIEINEVTCVLVPEPWNPHDSNAVIVSMDGYQVGYLPAELAEDFAGPLAEIAREGHLVTGIGRIWAKDDGAGIVRARVTILIPEAEVLES